MIRVTAPIALAAGQLSFDLVGWCASKETRPAFSARLGERPLQAFISDVDGTEHELPGMQSYAFRCPIDLRDALTGISDGWKSSGASIVIEIQNGEETGRVEYAVSEEFIATLCGSGSGIMPKPFPPEHLQVRIAGESGVAFSSFGDMAARQIAKSFEKATGRPVNEATVLDFGCGPARVTHVFRDMYPGVDLFGCDIDAEAIAWCRQNLPAVARFAVSDLLPPLPFEAGTFDLIYGISVFTHLPEAFQAAWLLELRRVLKPGGVLITTVHGPAIVEYIAQVYPGASALRDEVRDHGFVYVGTRREGWPSYFGVPTAGLPDLYQLSYCSHDYIRKHWSRYFEVLECGEFDLNILQDAIVCKKPTGDGQGDYERLALEANNAAARAAYAETQRRLDARSAELAEVSELLGRTDRALGEAQRLAWGRADELDVMRVTLAASEAALVAAKKDVEERVREVESMKASVWWAPRRLLSALARLVRGPR